MAYWRLILNYIVSFHKVKCRMRVEFKRNDLIKKKIVLQNSPVERYNIMCKRLENINIAGQSV